jgi:hypothetical protein
VVLVDHAAEHLPPLNWQVQRGSSQAVLIGWSLLAGLVGSVPVVMALLRDRRNPGVLSLHSYRATAHVVRELREFRPDAAILHWWLGSSEETEAAVEAGAYFSVNASQAKKWRACDSYRSTDFC